MTPVPGTNTPSGLRKAAILMVILGEDAASAVYKHLSPEEVERVTRGIAELKPFDAETALAVLEEFQRMVMAGDYLAQGGTEYANKLLVKAFGEEGARQRPSGPGGRRGRRCHALCAQPQRPAHPGKRERYHRQLGVR